MSTSRLKTFFHVLFVLSILLATSLDVKPASASTYTVTSTGDEADVTPGNNVCETATGNGVCTLRAAIQEANAHEGADTITFSINPTNPPIDRIINIGSSLPSISEQLTIQGPNLGTTGGGANIVLDGTDGSFTGLWITADNCVVRNLTIRNFDMGISSFDNTGLVIAGNRIGKFGYSGMNPANGNARDGIYLSGVSSSVIGGDTTADRNIISGNGANGITILDGAGILVRGNYIGVTENGSAALANAFSGIQIVGDSTGNTIGGSTAARRNIISGNTGDGILIKSNDNDVFGNYIGLAANGTDPLPNRIGIYLYSDSSAISGNEIGGVSAGQGNVISANTDSGIKLVKANQTLIKNNIIGLDATGSSAKPNSSGVYIISGDGNKIGTTDSDSGNVIAGNTGTGISMDGNDVTNTEIRRNRIGVNTSGSSFPNGASGIYIWNSLYGTIGGSSAYANVIANNTGNGIGLSGAFFQITHNSIYNNGSLGINLLTSPTDGVTLNDANDTDGGANDLQNFPVLTEVRQTSPGQVTIKGYLNSTASRSFNIHFYGNTTCDPSGYGEGQTYLDFVSISTATNSYGSFNTTLAVPAEIKFITATATDSVLDNTSEFSSCTPITQYNTFLPLIIK